MDEPDIYILRRQVLGILGGVGSIVSGVGSGINSAVSDVGSGVTSGLGDLTSAILPTTTASTTTSTSSSTSVTGTSIFSSSSSTTTTSTITSTSSTITSRSTLSSAVSLSSSTPSTSSFTLSPSSSPSIFTSTSDGVKETITAFVTPSASPSPSQTPTSSSSNGFLNNKPLEGFVFALCGIVVIVILFLVTTFALRRSRRKRMINEALSYEPTTTHGYVGDTDRDMSEKLRDSYSSAGSSSSRLGPPYSNGIVAASGYHGSSGLGQQVAHGYQREYPAHAPRLPNLAYDGYDMGRAQVMADYVPPAGISQPGLPPTNSRVPVPVMSPDSAAQV
ncbi:hypothetical protein J3R30DRAFT_3709793 [Lentinula aciculospora]|uniref:Uncharacterized protein n=1 Tax=Lentinula aciculospora TaxID=153920 RepID=A0A9W9DIM1_9AGAR|nr:hypothetical protein J3R30DRAFT_3709793 [Lentinula aciculospora]